MYRRTYHTYRAVAESDEPPPQDDQPPTPNEVAGGLAAAFAPIWLSIATGALMAVTEIHSSSLLLTPVVLIPLIGYVGLFRLFRPGLLMAVVLLLYLPIGAIATAALGWLSIVILGPNISLY